MSDINFFPEVMFGNDGLRVGDEPKNHTSDNR